MNINKLKEVLAIQSYSHQQWRMFAYLIREITRLNAEYFVHDGNIYITKGESDTYPCVIAHMDTVHKITSDLTVAQFGDNLTGFNTKTMEQTGIGGDDKVGIYIALECLEKFDNIKIAFFRDEEVGCEGSYEAYKEWFDDCGFILQCDRRGNSDFIVDASGVSLSSYNFQADIANIIAAYGYDFEYGMMTDVMALREIGVKASCANISCGYYNPHCSDEYVNVPDVSNCLDMVMRLINDLGANTYRHVIKKKKKKKYDANYDYWKKPYSKSEEEWWNKYKVEEEAELKEHKEEEMLCESCCNVTDMGDLIYARDYDMYLCSTCAGSYELYSDK